MALHNFVSEDAPAQKMTAEGGGGGEPRFYPGMKRNFTVQLGGTAYLGRTVMP